MKRICAILVFALMATCSWGIFPTNTSTHTVQLDVQSPGDYADFNFTWHGFEDQLVSFYTVTNQTGYITISPYYAMFRMSKRVSGGSNVVYVQKGTSDITINNSNIWFTVARTNVPPNGDYLTQLVLLDTTGTNAVRLLAAGHTRVGDSLWGTNDAAFNYPVNSTWFTNNVAVTITGVDISTGITAQVTGTILRLSVDISSLGGATTGMLAAVSNEVNILQTDVPAVSNLAQAASDRATWSSNSVVAVSNEVDDVQNHTNDYQAAFDHTGRVGVAAHSLGTASTNMSGDFYLASNPSGYVDGTVTNGSLALDGSTTMAGTLQMGAERITGGGNTIWMGGVADTLFYGTSFSPGTNVLYDLGTVSLYWRNVYAQNFYGNGAGISNVVAVGLNTAASNSLWLAASNQYLSGAATNTTVTNIVGGAGGILIGQTGQTFTVSSTASAGVDNNTTNALRAATIIVTNNTYDCITSALAQVTSGGEVYLPAGTYICTSNTIPMYTSNVTLRGADWNSTVLMATNGQTNAVILLNGFQNITIRDMKIMADRVAGGANHSIAGMAGTEHYLTLDHVYLQGAGSSCVRGESGIIGWNIKNCRMENSDDNVIYCEGEARVNNCWFSGNDDGLDVGGANSKFTGCYYSGGGSCVILRGDYSIIQGNYISGATASGCNPGAGKYGLISLNTFYNNVIGVRLQSATYYKVSGNSFDFGGNGQPDILCESNYNTVEDNNCKSQAGKSEWGIDLYTGSSYNTVKNNVCKGHDTAGINERATCVGNFISGNDCSGEVVAQYTLLGTGHIPHFSKGGIMTFFNNNSNYSYTVSSSPNQWKFINVTNNIATTNLLFGTGAVSASLPFQIKVPTNELYLMYESPLLGGTLTSISGAATSGVNGFDIVLADSTNPPGSYSTINYTGVYWEVATSNITLAIPVTNRQRAYLSITNGYGTGLEGILRLTE